MTRPLITRIKRRLPTSHSRFTHSWAPCLARLIAARSCSSESTITMSTVGTTCYLWSAGSKSCWKSSTMITQKKMIPTSKSSHTALTSSRAQLSLQLISANLKSLALSMSVSAKELRLKTSSGTKRASWPSWQALVVKLSPLLR